MIRLENLSKYYYGTSNVTCALHSINLELKIGELVAITGESGSGKTTLLNIISGIDSYEDGEMYINDKPTSYFDNSDWEQYRKTEVAFIFQNYNLIDSYTVLENVLVSLIIDGKSTQEAKKESHELLKMVGLDEHSNKKTSKLSGGQKQRLAIARALAKDAKIIVADEPTGNLDRENGKMIMELLKKISKDHLIIVVTHNQEEINPFATRKIRLHNGEIVSDEQNMAKIVETNIQPKEINENSFKQAFNLFKLNIKAQPRKSLLMVFLIFTLTFAMMAFIGTYASNYDDSSTKILTNEFFDNHDDTRIIVRSINGENINSNHLKKAKLNHVKEVEPYDYITDVNYFRPTDYRYVIISGTGEDDPTKPPVFVDNSNYTFTNFSHFMRSGRSLSLNELSKGRLPTNNLEMVVYSDDASIINTKETVFFCDTKSWGSTKYIKYDITIVGILKEKTDQAYFSDDICNMINMNIYNHTYNFYYIFKDVSRKLISNFICVDYTLEDNEISLPKDKYELLKKYSNNNLLEYSFSTTLFGTTSFYRGGNIDFSKELEFSNFAIGVSPLFFEEIMNFHSSVGYPQFAVFIDDYAYTDDVIRLLSEEGLASISCYRSSTSSTDSSKVLIRFITLTISVAALILIFIIEIVLCYSLSRLKKNDFIILKMIGLSSSSSKKLNYIEMAFYGIVSYLLVVVCCVILKFVSNNQYIVKMFKYIRFYHYLILLVIVLLSMFFTSYIFNRYLSKNTKVTKLKEE